MVTGSAIRPSSSIPPLVTTLVVSDHGKVVGSRVRECKIIRLGHSNIQFARPSHLNSGQLNFSESVMKDHTEFSLHQRRKAKLVANAGSEFTQNAQDSVVYPQIAGKSLRATFDIFCRFTRFHTLRGSALGIISSCLLAVQSLSDFTPSYFHGLLQAIIGGCLANSFVVGLNQVTDIEIDKVNKPYLPLASGDLSVESGILLTALYAVLGLCLALYIRSWSLQLGLFIWYALGAAYSVDLPLLRWKAANPVLPVMCIWSVRGVIIPILFNLHAQACIPQRPLLLSKHVIFSSGLLSIFAVAIALFKDIPDVEGDRKNGIKTFASEIGQTQIFWICIWLLEMAFGMAIIVGLSSTRFWIRQIMVISHIILGFVLWKYANMVDLKSKKDFESLYRLIWKLLYVEYLLLPIIRF